MPHNPLARRVVRSTVRPAGPSGPTDPALPAALLSWYDRARRDLPWRVPPGGQADPYRVWISEIMLQQTTVAAVIPFFRGFVARWPDVMALATADLDAVLHAWQGLGYYARARNLHACARRITDAYGGRFPDDEAALRSLPGIGEYTAAAIAAIAFGRRATPVDGNVLRVVARVFATEDPLPQARAAIGALARTLTPEHRPGDFAQAMMDLGATLCMPRAPRCTSCPWQHACAAFAAGAPEAYPRRLPRSRPELRFGTVFWAERDGQVLLRRRPPHGLLGGLMEFPSTPWTTQPVPPEAAVAMAPVAARWVPLAGEVRHTFTHFRLVLQAVRGHFTGTAEAASGCRWWPLAELPALALPTLMKKVAAHVTGAGATPVLPLDAEAAPRQAPLKPL